MWVPVSVDGSLSKSDSRGVDQHTKRPKLCRGLHRGLDLHGIGDIGDLAKASEVTRDPCPSHRPDQ